MSYLQKARKAAPQAPILTIVGFPKVGKSTLGGLFPSPVFIQAENAETIFEQWDEDIKPLLLPQIPHANYSRGVRPSEVIMAQLRELATEEHPYKTVIIDSITTAHALFENEVVEFYRPNGAEPVSNIGEAEGGFGKGFLAVAGIHARIRSACEYLRNKGISVVFLAHTGMDKIKNRPDVESYATWSIAMHEASRRVYIATSDAVLYLRSRDFVTGSETDKKGRVTKLGKIRSTGERYLVTSSEGTVGFVDAGNRYRMPPEIEVEEGENPILQYIPFYKG